MGGERLGDGYHGEFREPSAIERTLLESALRYPPDVQRKIGGLLDANADSLMIRDRLRAEAQEPGLTEGPKSLRIRGAREWAERAANNLNYFDALVKEVRVLQRRERAKELFAKFSLLKLIRGTRGSTEDAATQALVPSVENRRLAGS